MINIKILNDYQRLAQEGIYKPISCMDKDHHVPLVSRLEDDDTISMYCVMCNYKIKPGLALYDVAKRRVEQHFAKNPADYSYIEQD